MNEFEIIVDQTPGIVSFDNYAEIRSSLQNYIQETFDGIDYEKEGLKIATADRDELKGMRDVITKKQKELKEAYSAPYITVEKMLDELVSMIDKPYKRAKSFVDDAEKEMKRYQIMDYAAKQAEELGEVGKKIIDSPAFFNAKWLNKNYTVKKYQDEIKGIMQQAAKDIPSIQATGGDNTAVLMARYYETLSMDGVKSFLETLNESQEDIDPIAMSNEKNVLGYKILKITGTEDQMAALLDQMDLMGLEVEEIEDGMPKDMEELTEPNFDSFVAFDIETTGTNGAAAGDSEAKITEIGAVRVVNGEVMEKFDMLANPGRKIVPRIARLTHITDEMVKDQPSVDEVIRKFHEFAGDNILVGHNIKSSDLRYITKAADQAGIHFDGAFLDTYLLAKKFKEQKNWEKVNLGYLAGQYGFEHKEAHRAWSDAEVNAQVYFELQKLFVESPEK